MVDININITLKDKKLLNDIKYKYHLSYSTIIDIIIMPMFILCGENIHKKIYEDKQKHRLHVKPRQRYENVKAREYENAIKIFLRKDYDKYKRSENIKYIDNDTNKEYYEDFEKTKQRLLSKIYNRFKETYEENWDGNREARSITRFIRKNPEYVRKLVEND